MLEHLSFLNIIINIRTNFLIGCGEFSDMGVGRILIPMSK